MSADQSKLLTDLVMDDPVETDADYRMDEDDRRFIDNEILACEQHLVELVLPGYLASYLTLDGGSAALAKGDCFTVGPTGTAFKSDSSAVVVDGIAPAAVSPGAKFRGIKIGVISPVITGLSTGSNGWVRLNGSTGRCELLTTPIGFGDIPLGWSTLGWLTFLPRAKNLAEIIPPTNVGDTNKTVANDGTEFVIAMGTRTAPRTVTLPASPPVGFRVVVIDASGQAGANAITVDGNGNNINGAATNVLNTNYASGTYYYTGATHKWVKV
jgi:hypothetical protein